MKPAVTVDIGTTSVKLCLFDAAGNVVLARKHPTPTQQDGWGEVYDVEALWAIISSFVTGLAERQRSSVERVAIAGVGESGGLVGPDLRLVSPMILWHDQRGAGVLTKLRDEDRAAIYRVTGLPVNANYALSKIAWAVDHAGASARDATWLNVSEFVAARMTGRRWAERSLASRTMALDLRTGSWSPEMTDMVGVDVSALPEIRPAAHGETVSREFAARAGLPGSVQVHVAGHDHMVGGVGAGLRQGELLNSTGTTEGLLLLDAQPALDHRAAEAQLANGLACEGDGYTLFASIPTGGAAFRTLQRMLGMSAPILSACVESLTERYLDGRIDLASVPVVVPQFRGSPPPEKSSIARGTILNLGPETTDEDIVFGCFLGMAVQFRKVLELFPVRPTTMKVIGPASANPLWLHLKADVLANDLSVSAFDEVVSRGAQVLASGGVGSWEDCAPQMVEADEGRHHRLADWHRKIQPSIEHLRGLSW